MYLLQIVLNVHYGNTGFVDRHVENYESETLKPLLIKSNKRIEESSDDVSFNVSFYKIEREYVTQIKDHSFDFEKWKYIIGYFIFIQLVINVRLIMKINSLNPFMMYAPIMNIHDYLWFKITDFKGYPVSNDFLKNMLKHYFRSLYL